MFELDVFIDALFSAALLQGALLSLALSVAVQVVTILIAVITGSLATSQSRMGRWSIIGYVWFFRATPALLVLLFIWNGLPQMFPVFRQGWFTPFIAAFIALSLIQVAYTTEILRAAYAAIGKGQSEGAAALGLSKMQTLLLILLPQALRIALPGLMNEFIALLKATSLATIISLKELMTVTQYAIATSFRFLEWYSAAALYYLAIVSVLTAFQMRIEARLSRGYQR